MLYSSPHAPPSPPGPPSSNITRRQEDEKAQLLSEILDFSPRSSQAGSRPNWQLSRDWRWDIRGGPKGQIHSSPEEFLNAGGEEYADFTAQKSTKLGSGFSGDVDRVLCNGRFLARKCTSMDHRKTGSWLANMQEIKITKKLSHQHIAQLLGIYVLGSDLYSLSYPVAEMDLHQYMKMGRIYDMTWVRSLVSGMGCLSNALAYAHRAGIKHRDIHGGNILVIGGTMILCDWGTAKCVLISRYTFKQILTFISYSAGHRSLPAGLPSGYDSKPEDVRRLGHVFEMMLAAADGDFRDTDERYDEDRNQGRFFTPQTARLEIDEFVDGMISGPQWIEREDLRGLIRAMDAENMKARPSAKGVSEYLRLGSIHLARNNEGDIVCGTCGDCCA